MNILAKTIEAYEFYCRVCDHRGGLAPETIDQFVEEHNPVWDAHSGMMLLDDGKISIDLDREAIYWHSRMTSVGVDLPVTTSLSFEKCKIVDNFEGWTKFGAKPNGSGPTGGSLQ